MIVAGLTDAVGTNAKFRSIKDIVLVSNTLFVSDNSNSVIRSVDTVSLRVTTFASVNSPWGIVYDNGGNILVASVDDRVIYKFAISSATKTVFAGQVGKAILFWLYCNSFIDRII